MDEIKHKTEAPQVCPSCRRREDIQDRIATLLEEVLEQVQKKANENKAEVKATIPELMKLLQLNREYQQDRVKEIKVTWITTKKQSQSAA